MRLDEAVNIEDLRGIARRRLPKVSWDFLEGGCDDEEGLAHNHAALSRYRLTPRYLVDVSRRDTSATIFGRTYSSPIGIAPTGLVGLFRRGGELMFAKAAAKANVPYAMSCMATATLEEAAALAGENLWLQIYGANNRALGVDLVKRARDAGVTTLILTVDAPVHSRRERNFRNGFGGKMPLSVRLEALLHPGWVLELLRGGPPILENYRSYVPRASSSRITAYMGEQVPSPNQTWGDLEAYRAMWPGKLMVKGVLHPEDARRAVALGADGVYVSNHGGRQLDRAPAPIEMLPLIRAAIGDRARLVIDSGIRRGADVILARCLGADIAFLGRPPVYGAAAGGLPGVLRAIEMLNVEIDILLAQLGCSSLDDLGPHILFDSEQGRFYADAPRSPGPSMCG